MHIAATYLGPDVRHDAWIYEGPSGGRLAVIATIRSGNAVGEARRRGRQNLDDGIVDVSRLLSGMGWVVIEGRGDGGLETTFLVCGCTARIG